MKLIIIGYGMHALQVLDVSKLCGYEFIGFIDDYNKEKTLGGTEILPKFLNSDIYFFVGIGESLYRRNVLNKNNLKLCNIIHPNSIISKNIKIGNGNYIGPSVVINNDVTIGDNNILNTSSIIEHNVVIGNFCNINPNVTICGSCFIEDNVNIGASTTIIQKKRIGKNSVLGAGSLVLKDIKSYTLNYGTPTKEINKIEDNYIIFK